MKRIATVLLLGIATPATAQGAPWAASGDWSIERERDACTLTYAPKDSEGIVAFRQNKAKLWSLVTVTSRRIAAKAPEGPTLVDAGSLEGKGVARESLGDGRVRVEARLEPAIWEAAWAKRVIRLSWITDKNEHLDMPLPTDPQAEQAFEACLDEGRRIQQGSVEPAVTPPMLRGRQSDMITREDHPLWFTIGKRIGGRVRMRLLIGERGQVIDCEVLESSGNAKLDNTACGIFIRRGRFFPAKDAEGRPTSGHYELTHDWPLSPYRKPITFRYH